MNESINTLQEFMVQTKGTCYIMLFGYFAAFVAFWRFLFAGDKKDERKLGGE